MSDAVTRLRETLANTDGVSELLFAGTISDIRSVLDELERLEAISDKLPKDRSVAVLATGMTAMYEDTSGDSHQDTIHSVGPWLVKFANRYEVFKASEIVVIPEEAEEGSDE